MHIYTHFARAAAQALARVASVPSHSSRARECALGHKPRQLG